LFPADTDGLIAAFERWRERSVELEHGRIQIEFLMLVPPTLTPELLERDAANFIELRPRELIAGVALVPEDGASAVRSILPSVARCGTRYRGSRGRAQRARIRSRRAAARATAQAGARAFGVPGTGMAGEIVDGGVHVEFCPFEQRLYGRCAGHRDRHPIGAARAARFAPKLRLGT